MSVALQTYNERLPSPSTPISLRIPLDEQAALAVFGDDQWDMSPLSGKRSASRQLINFELTPAPFRAACKRLVWAWINEPTPLDQLDRKTMIRERISSTTIVAFYREDLLPFLRYLANAGFESLSELTTEDLDTYASTITRRSLARERKARILFTISRIWLHSPYLPTADRLRRPSWESDEGMVPLLGAAVASGENKTEPVHPQTMSPLLVWSLRIVEDFSGDIEAAIARRSRLVAGIPENVTSGDGAVVRHYLNALHETGLSLPGVRRQGELVVAQDYLSGLLRVGKNAVTSRATAGFPIAEGASLDVRIDGRLPDGRPWTETIDFYEVGELRSILATACLVVVAYLSGARTDEVRELRRGCCTSTTDDAGQQRHEVRGLEFKSAVDEDGNAIPGGRMRERPWYAITPVATAIAVAERLSSSDLVFDSAIFHRYAEVKSDGSAISSHTARDRIATLIRWANALAERSGAQDESIPDDPDGNVTLVRFRRTLAWFIYRRPGGRIALGVQYGHLRGYTAEGYGARTRSGMRGVFPMEEVRSIADTLNDAVVRLDAGEGVSGPAAGRYIGAVAAFRAEFAGQWMTTRQSTALRRNPKYRVYDNGLQPVACCYDASKALCHPDRDRRSDTTKSPDLTRCIEGCGNAARTDQHAEMLVAEIDELAAAAGSELIPEPIRRRFGQRSAHLTELLVRHETTRTTTAAPGEQ